MKVSLQHCRSLLFVCLLILVVLSSAHAEADDDGDGHELVSPDRLEMFVDDLPHMSKIRGYIKRDGAALPRSLTIGMFEKKWRFHRDMPLTRVFAYGTSKSSATVPGPCIEALQGVETRVTWVNYLPRWHILPWDPTIPTAKVPHSLGGIPTVVHLHGAITHPASDGNPNAWFTSGFNTTGPTWSQRQCVYPNVQEPGNLWYHDHAMGLTRVNLLVGLLGTYVIRNPAVELSLCLPSGDIYDRHLVVFDRSFLRDGSVYLNSTGNNPSIHPQWQPEYFGDVIIVNGKVWPVLRVRRQRYRFRVINASNARFFRFFLSNGQEFVHVGSDSMYLRRPHRTRRFLLAPSEIADVVVDFAESRTNEVILRNNAPYPYPAGDPANEETSGKVMKFVIESGSVRDPSRIPEKLLWYPRPRERKEMKRRYVAMYEYQSETMEPTHLYLNGRPYQAPATETPRAGETEVWEVINLTADNHPLHVHLGLFVVAEQRELKGVEELRGCMMRKNDARRCRVEGYVSGKRRRVHEHERGWKNVYKMRPGYLTRILVRFALTGANGSEAYPFDATDEPGYVYHCHILDHEDNEMMRPLKIIK